MHASRKRHSHLESDCSTSYEWIATRGYSVGVRPTLLRDQRKHVQYLEDVVKTEVQANKEANAALRVANEGQAKRRERSKTCLCSSKLLWTRSTSYQWILQLLDLSWMQVEDLDSSNLSSPSSRRFMMVVGLAL